MAQQQPITDLITRTSAVAPCDATVTATDR